jgi:hypothetical protein
MQSATAEATALRSFLLLVPVAAVMLPAEADTPKLTLVLQVALRMLVDPTRTCVMLTELSLLELLMANVALALCVPVEGAVTETA